MGFWILLLLARLVDLQVVRHEEWVKRAKRQQERTIELPPRRGAILDRDGRPLAVTATVESIFAIPSEIDDAAGTAAVLAPLLGLPLKEVKRKLSDPDKEFVWLARRVPEPISRRVASRRLPGVRLIAESTRRYPQGALAGAILGYVGSDNQGLAGLEYRYESEVRGRPARVTFLRDAAQRAYADASGRPGRTRASRAEAADGVEGASLSLTMDASIQHVAERALVKAAEASHARGGSAVVMDPETGAILALASYPNFDPNRFNEFDADARRCRPMADSYEPGSTFKVITASAALEAGTIGADDMIDCGGGVLTIGKTTIHEHGGNRWGILSLGDVLAHSSNIGIAHVALGLGRGPFYGTVRAFGFGQRTGIDLDGETGGILASPSSWSALTLPTMSFGQEVGVTVLQMARAYSAIANGGRLPTPQLVAEIHRDGRTQKIAPRPAPRVISEETARSLRRLMARVVEMGTGKLAAIEGYTAAGKTGTAQKAIPGGGYSRDRYVASFIGFAPAESPRVVIAVVLDEPKGKIFGGDVAAPVFAVIGAQTLRILHAPLTRPPDRLTPTILTADLRTGSQSATGTMLSEDLVPASNRTNVWGSVRDVDHSLAARRLVPDVSAESAREAVRTLARRGIVCRLEGHGFVVHQDPPAGSPLEGVMACTLRLSLEPPPLAQETSAVLEPPSAPVVERGSDLASAASVSAVSPVAMVLGQETAR